MYHFDSGPTYLVSNALANKTNFTNTTWDKNFFWSEHNIRSPSPTANPRFLGPNNCSCHYPYTRPISRTPNLSTSTSLLFTNGAQLTFGLSTTTEVNVAIFFLNRVQESKTYLPDFTLLPYDTTTNTEPAPEPTEIQHNYVNFFQTYYANHPVLCHGQLTGMVHFQTTVSWSAIKSFKDPYFTWLIKEWLPMVSWSVPIQVI